MVDGQLAHGAAQLGEEGERLRGLAALRVSHPEAEARVGVGGRLAHHLLELGDRLVGTVGRQRGVAEKVASHREAGEAFDERIQYGHRALGPIVAQVHLAQRELEARGPGLAGQRLELPHRLGPLPLRAQHRAAREAHPSVVRIGLARAVGDLDRFGGSAAPQERHGQAGHRVGVLRVLGEHRAEGLVRLVVALRAGQGFAVGLLYLGEPGPQLQGLTEEAEAGRGVPAAARGRAHEVRAVRVLCVSAGDGLAQAVARLPVLERDEDAPELGENGQRGRLEARRAAELAYGVLVPRLRAVSLPERPERGDHVRVDLERVAKLDDRLVGAPLGLVLDPTLVVRLLPGDRVLDASGEEGEGSEHREELARSRSYKRAAFSSLHSVSITVALAKHNTWSRS